MGGWGGTTSAGCAAVPGARRHLWKRLRKHRSRASIWRRYGEGEEINGAGGHPSPDPRLVLLKHMISAVTHLKLSATGSDWLLSRRPERRIECRLTLRYPPSPRRLSCYTSVRQLTESDTRTSKRQDLSRVLPYSQVRSPFSISFVHSPKEQLYRLECFEADLMSPVCACRPVPSLPTFLSCLTVTIMRLPSPMFDDGTLSTRTPLSSSYARTVRSRPALSSPAASPKSPPS
jgi:hypothetical protein